MPIGELVAGAALGLTLQVLHEAIKKAKGRSLTTKCILDRLDSTISMITPLVNQVDKLSERVEVSQRKVIEELKHLLEKAVLLIEAYAELKRRNLLKKFRYKSKIKELEASLRWMVDVDVQVNQWLDIKELTTKMSEMNTKLEQITCQPTDCDCFSGPIKAYHKVVIKIQETDLQGKIKKARVMDLNQGLISTFGGLQEQETKIVRSDSWSSDVLNNK